MIALASEAEDFLHRPGDGTHSTDPFVVGPAPLAPGREGGPLGGLRFAVKDLYDVRGTRTGVGNPSWLSESEVCARHAAVIERLVSSGADLVGKTVTDELAFSLSGTNIHYGTPLNPVDPDVVPGGSSSGSAAAVASERVDFALGTDTGGSTRVPASYCRIYGFRATHGRVSCDGVYLLAPSFCSFGLFTNDASMLERCWRELAGDQDVVTSAAMSRRAGVLLVCDALFDLADVEARSGLERAVARMAEELGLPVRGVDLAGITTPGEVFTIFRTIQMFEAWPLHGPWVMAHPGAIGPGIAARFQAASHITADDAGRARTRRSELRNHLGELFGDGGYLLQPAASGPAPSVSRSGPAKDDLRMRTMTLTASAGVMGAPVVSVPVVEVGGHPVGVALVGQPGDDEEVLRLAKAVGRARRSHAVERF